MVTPHHPVVTECPTGKMGARNIPNPVVFMASLAGSKMAGKACCSKRRPRVSSPFLLHKLAASQFLGLQAKPTLKWCIWAVVHIRASSLNTGGLSCGSCTRKVDSG
uniref:Uncharacterized protein n=1 Tax=Sphaerodactylus townsendi TaxID=933632 RepID=A0ACB8EQ19_9SAUR